MRAPRMPLTPRRHVISAHDSATSAEPTSAAPALQDPSLIDIYQRYFDVIPANTPELIEQAYRLRYEVYCVENAFENPAEHPDGLERDEFDSHSVHSLLIHRETGQVAGTVRLILPDPRHPLPITQICSDPLLRDPILVPPGRTAEVSRFAVSKSFRRRATDKPIVDGGFMEPRKPDPGDRRVIPHITLGLMKAVTQMSREHGITHLCAVMEPALLRLLGRLGIQFTPVGPLVDHHGRRQPCYGPLDDILAGIYQQRPDASDVITDGGRFWKSDAPPPVASSA